MEKVIEKETVLEDLWNILEKTPKMIKSLSDNIASNSIREATFGELARAVDYIPIIEKSLVGSFYKYDSYDDAYIVAKMIGFASLNESYYKIKLRVLYASKIEIRYTTVTDFYYIDIKDMISWKEFTVNYEDLPLHVGEAFTGTLLSEMIKNDK